MTVPNINLLWLRRDLRLHDHGALHGALAAGKAVQPVFIFDRDILARFNAKDDRRLSFIADRLCLLHLELTKRGGGLLVLHGRPQEIIPALAKNFSAELFAARDYEPETMRRDEAVAAKVTLNLVKDHLIFAPDEITREGEAYKVYTPYSKNWLARLTPASSAPYPIHDKGRYADFAASVKHAGLPLIDAGQGAKAMLKQVGYEHQHLSDWPADDGLKRLNHFIQSGVSDYDKQRNFVAHEGTSRLSPYLRFGMVSVRECLKKAQEALGSHTWIKELIWREFYAMILYHYPNSARENWNPKYASLDWANNPQHFEAWKAGQTGYPLVDAAMRQLTTTGWMHNRARMVVASFLTKDLRIDWRLGEEHFAQYLMDYELASNAGGWQWAASTGTDAQPWFRIFNPYLQSKKFDANGDYIRTFVPELAGVKGEGIHEPTPLERPKNYPAPIVDHYVARDETLAMFKQAGG